MATLLIGDFRGIQLKQHQAKNSSSFGYTYLLEDTGEYSWLSTSVASQLPLKTFDIKNVVIMLGFNDCTYSCVWPSVFDINKIASNYVKVVNDFIAQYPELTFYFCSVNPIDADYPFAEYSTGIILKDDLNKKIKQFNNKIATLTNSTPDNKLTFINSYNYLSSTNFDTYDGARYKSNTCGDLLSFITSQLKNIATSTFKPRITNDHAPVVTEDIESDLYWRASSAGTSTGESVNYGGLNPFNTNYGNIPNKNKPWDTLPNCTAYAWGRFYEILGTEPKLSRANAEQWYSYTSDGYSRGSTPAEGAIICWEGVGTDANGKERAGHVAIVEKVNSDGSIITSESGWQDSRYWWCTPRTNENGNWGANSNYKFQGFIYYSVDSGIQKEHLWAKNSYDISIEEMKINAQYIWQFLKTRGWTLNAIAGLLGNIQQESQMSPTVWETATKYTSSQVSQLSNGTYKVNEEEVAKIAKALKRYEKDKNKNIIYDESGNPVVDKDYVGYGLTQWTPYTKYTTWCNDGKLNGTGRVLPFWDIDSQLLKIIDEAKASVEPGWNDYRDQWIAAPKKGYDLSFTDFITSTKDAYWLSGAFAFCYERPGRSTGSAQDQEDLRRERGEYGEFWYSYLSGLDPQLKVFNFKLDKYSTTSIAFSFIVHNGVSASYKITKEKNKIPIIDKTITNLTNSLQIVEIKNKLVPDTKYTLELEILDVNNRRYTEKKDFTTPQDYPDPVKSIELDCVDKLKSTESQFKLSVVKPSRLGYWKAKCGYEKYLIVNHKKVKTIITNDVSNIKAEKFNIKKEFNYECKTGDIIQIGISVWVKDNNGKPIYAETKTSKPICLLNRAINTYLNIN